MPGSYPSLTNPGGIFEAINANGASGNITINITADLSGETGTVFLNEVAGGFSVLVKPSGAPRTITGTGATTSLIKLNAADNVTFDGSLSGGTDRSLTLTNTNTGGTIADEGPDAAVPALNRVFHDASRPSRLLLPTVDDLMAGV